MSNKLNSLNKARLKTISLLLLLVVSMSFVFVDQPRSATANSLSQQQNCTPQITAEQDHGQLYRLPVAGDTTITRGPIHGAHNGPEAIDFGVSSGTPVLAARSGRLFQRSTAYDPKLGRQEGYGMYVEIVHDSSAGNQESSIYAHLSSYVGVNNREVQAGDLIGYSGSTGDSTGPHLHLEVIVNGVSTPIRQIPGVHWNQVEKNGYSVFCNLDYWVNNQNANDGYAVGGRANDPSIRPYDGMTDKCARMSYAGVIIFEQDNCEGNSWSYNFTGFDILMSHFQPQSIYIGTGWSAIIDDGQNNYLCARRSLWDITLDYYHPVANRPIEMHINRVYPFKDGTCGGRDTNNDGMLDAGKTLPPYSIGGVGGGDPNAQSPDPSAPSPSNPPIDPSKKLVLCKGFDYTDCKYELTVGWYEVPHQEYRSITIPSGWSFILIDWSDGHESCFNTSLPKLTDHESWQFKIGEVVVVDSNVCTSNGGGHSPDPLGNNQVRYWMKPGYTGSSTAIEFTNETNTYWLSDFDFAKWGGFNFNDDVESFELNTQTANRSMALYRDSMLQGPAKCFTGSVDNLWSYKFNDGSDVANQASSARFFVGIGCDLRPQTPQEIWIHQADKNKVVLTWPWGGPDDDGYYVYLYDGTNYQKVATLNWTEARDNAKTLGLNEYIRSWTWTGATCGKEYSFVVSAWNEFGESNKTHSVKVKTPDCDCNDVTTPGGTLFEDALCRGNFVELSAPGYYTLNQFNDKASAFKLASGWSAELFENTSSSDGLATCITESKWDMSYDFYWPVDVKINDTSSAVKLYNTPNCGRKLPMVGCDAITYDGVALFDYSQCLGSDTLINQPGYYELAERNTSSIHVQTGWSVRVYEQSNRGGFYSCLNETKWDMAYDPFWHTDLRMNNNIAAVEVYHDSFCGAPQVPELYWPNNVEVQQSENASLMWQDVGAGTYWVEIWGPQGFFRSSGPKIRPGWDLGQLQPGTYVWKVKTEVLGVLSEWAEANFTVAVSTSPIDCGSLNSSSILVYAEKDCRGEGQQFGVGKYDLIDTSWNDKIMAIYVPTNMSIKVYQDSWYTGLTSCFGGSMWNLAVDKYWGSDVFVGMSISSFQVFENSNCEEPTPTPTFTPTATSTSTPTNTPTRTPTNTPTSTPTSTGVQPGVTPPTATYTPTPTTTATPTPTSTGSVTPSPQGPIQPSGLVVSAIGQTSVSLAWNDNSSNETGFIVSKSEGQAFVEIGRVSANTKMFVVNNLICGKAYKFKVVAFNALGFSMPTDELSVTTTNCVSQSVQIYLPLITR